MPAMLQPSSPKIVTLVIPHKLATRYTIETPILPLPAHVPDLTVDYISKFEDERATVESYGVNFKSLQAPSKELSYLTQRDRLTRLKGVLHHAVGKITGLQKWSAHHDNLRYRFNKIKGFTAHQHKKQWSSERHADFRCVYSPSLGEPYPGSAGH